MGWWRGFSSWVATISLMGDVNFNRLENYYGFESDQTIAKIEGLVDLAHDLLGAEAISTFTLSNSAGATTTKETFGAAAAAMAAASQPAEKITGQWSQADGDSMLFTAAPETHWVQVSYYSEDFARGTAVFDRLAQLLGDPS